MRIPLQVIKTMTQTMYGNQNALPEGVANNIAWHEID
jgi:hypothetical protein